MIKKLVKMSTIILAFVLLFTFTISVAFAAEYLGPTLLQPQLSSDGNTLYNAHPAVVYTVDSNPPAQQAHIQAPASSLRTQQQRVTSASATATFTITYVANGGKDPWGESCSTFPDDAKTAFSAAAAIWGNLLQSAVPITISACWSSLGSTSILGYSGGGNSYKNFTGAPLTDTWYSASLANALHGSDLDASSFDMHITLNSGFTWYSGTDGVTPTGQYDLVTVALHHIANGLNFSAPTFYYGTLGYWGLNTGYPTIYDTFMKDGTANPGNLLINTSVYPNPSRALGTALKSNSIWFHGANAMAANGGTRVKMNAPTTWVPGYSYSHLDYTTFAGGANRLMVGAIASGTATHNPGPVALGILKDMGWSITTNTKLYANFTNSGLYEWNGTTWSQINPTVATKMAASGTNLYACFANGLVKWNGTAWTGMHNLCPTIMTAGGTDLYATFASFDGIYRWNGTAWSQITTTFNPTIMTAAGTNLYAAITGLGIYKWNGTDWSGLHNIMPASLAAAGTALYVVFTDYGLFKYTGTDWSGLHNLAPTIIAAAGTDLYATFASYDGIYRWNGTAWSQITTTYNPTIMTAASTDLYTSIPSYGVYKWNGTTWSGLHNLTAESIAAVEEGN